MVLAESVAQAISGSAMVCLDHDRLALMATVNGAIGEFRRQGGIQGVMLFISGDLEAKTSAVAQLSPFPGAEFYIADADSIGAVKHLDFTFMAADVETRLRNGALKIFVGGSGNFAGAPEFMIWRQEQRSNSFGRPIRGSGATISLCDCGKLIGPT